MLRLFHDVPSHAIIALWVWNDATLLWRLGSHGDRLQTQTQALGETLPPQFL